MVPRSENHIDIEFDSEVIEETFALHFALRTVASPEMIERARLYEDTLKSHEQKKGMFQGYKLFIVFMLWHFLDGVIREPNLLSLPTDQGLRDHWSYKEQRRDLLLQIPRKGSPVSAVMARVVSYWQELVEAQSWDELSLIALKLRGFALTLQQVFESTYQCQNLTKKKFRSVSPRLALLEEAPRLVWQEMNDIDLLRGTFPEVYRSSRHQSKIIEGVDEELEYNDPVVPRFEAGKHRIRLQEQLPESWLLGYVWAFENTVTRLCIDSSKPSPFAQDFLCGFKSWGDFDRTVSTHPSSITSGERFLFSRNRAVTRHLLRKLSMPTPRLSGTEQLRGLMGSHLRMVDWSEPTAAFNFARLLEGCVAEARKLEAKVRVVRIKHEYGTDIVSYSLAVFMPLYGEFFSNASMWWVFFEAFGSTRDSIEARKVVKEALDKHRQWVELEDYTLDRETFWRMCEDEGYLYLRDQLRKQRDLDSQVRGVFPELLAAAMLSSWQLHPTRLGVKPEFLKGEELDVVGVHWLNSQPVQYVVIECKGRATADDELRKEIDYFADKIDTTTEHVDDLARILDVPKGAKKVRAIFISMREHGFITIKTPPTVELWDLPRFLHELSSAGLTSRYTELLGRKLLATTWSVPSWLWEWYLSEDESKEKEESGK